MGFCFYLSGRESKTAWVPAKSAMPLDSHQRSASFIVQYNGCHIISKIIVVNQSYLLILITCLTGVKRTQSNRIIQQTYLCFSSEKNIIFFSSFLCRWKLASMLSFLYYSFKTEQISYENVSVSGEGDLVRFMFQSIHVLGK